MQSSLVHQPFTLTTVDLHNIVYGACFFASGGGGPLEMALSFLQRIDKPLSFINAWELHPHHLALVVADMGSPDAAKEGKGFTAPVNVYKALEQSLVAQGHTVSYLMPIELGAVNTLLPFYVASCLDTPLPVINADPSGRAVPQLNMTLLDVAGVPICPAAVASDTDLNGSYQSHIFTQMTATELEDASRDVVTSYGGVGGLACYPVDGSVLNPEIAGNANRLIQGSIGLCWEVGKRLLDYGTLHALQELLEVFSINSYVFIVGTIKTLENRTAGGFDVGKVVLEDENGKQLWVYYKNESLLAWDPQTKAPLAMAPDGISFITASGGQYPAGTPASNAEITQGASYHVLGLSAFAKLRNPTLEQLFLQNIQEVLVAFPEDGVQVNQYQTIEDLNSNAI